MNWVGTRWFKGDFHVHTPFSRCYKQHGVSAQDFFTRVQDLDFVVVADHNTFDGYLHLLEYSDPGTVLFPGIELKVPSGYGGLSLITILDPQFSPETLETFLREIGLGAAERGDKRALVQKSLPEILRVIDKYGGILLWTRVYSPEGLLGGLDEKQREYVLRLSRNNGILDLGPEGGEQVGVWGSNAHSLAEIAPHSMVKLEQLNFSGLKFALQDLHGRVRSGLNPLDLNYPRILSLQVAGGFLDDQVFEFNPGLNCLIGPRGTGKSTALRLLSFALGTEVKPAELGGLVEVQVTMVEANGELFRVKRRVGQKPRAYDRLGRLMEREVMGLGMFFAQGEIEQVVLKPDFQLELLDSTWDSAGLIEARRLAHRELQFNNQRLAELGKEVDGLLEQLSGKELLVRRQEQLADYPLVEMQSKLTEKERELQALDTLQEVIRNNKKLLRQLPWWRESMPEAGFLEIALEQTRQRTGELLQLWEDSERELAEYGREMAERHDKLEEEYSTRLGGYTDTRLKELIREREKIQAELVRLEPVEVRLAAAEHERAGLEQNRLGLLKEWERLARKLYQARCRAAGMINRSLYPELRLEVKHQGLTRGYHEFLQKWLGQCGGGIVSILERKVTPAKLAGLLQAGVISPLAEGCGLTPERARQVVNVLGSREALLELETLDISDSVNIYLREAGSEKGGGMLSTGQRCTAVLPLVLLAGHGPVIIDQPEDHLDNAYIFSGLVQSIRGKKDGRQFIFATHNPNIPVLADADMNFILAASGKNGWIGEKGSVECERVREKIQEIMEGGKDAFRWRARCYGEMAD